MNDSKHDKDSETMVNLLITVSSRLGASKPPNNLDDARMLARSAALLLRACKEETESLLK